VSFSVVMPSKSASNLAPCIRAIRDAGETCRVIVVDDGVDFAKLCFQGLGPYQVVSGVKPFCFARNVNLGIRAAGTDDVILLNDDALLKTRYGFTSLERLSLQEDLGLIAASCDTVGNQNQFRQPGSRLREEKRMVCFVCVCIPRATIDEVGLLDERFTGYGMDDDDYCLRVRNAGLKIGIFDGCFVDHASLKSSFRAGPLNGGDFRPNMRRFIEKWGVDNWGHGREASMYPDLFPAATP
jgi:GT2 family glycosyltransferase